MSSRRVGENRLIVNISPWFTRGMGLLFFIIGLCLFAVFNTMYEIRCADKLPTMAQQCVFISNTAFLFKEKTNLGELKGASLYSWKNSKGKRQYKIKLIADQGTSFGSFTFNFSNQLDDVVTDINRYVERSSDTTLYIGSIAGVLMNLFAGAFALVGFLVFINSSGIIIDVDKTLQLIFIKRKSLISTNSEEIAFNDVESFDIESSLMRKGQQVFRIIIRTKDGEIIPVEENYDSLYPRKVKIIHEISQFMGEINEGEMTTLDLQYERKKKIGVTCFIIAMLTIVLSYLIRYFLN